VMISTLKDSKHIPGDINRIPRILRRCANRSTVASGWITERRYFTTSSFVETMKFLTSKGGYNAS